MFVHPLFLAKSPSEQQASSPYFPLGLLYLAGFVRHAGHAVSIFDGTFCNSEQDFAERLAQEQPDVVGISALQPTKDDALLLATMAAETGAVVILGGPDPTLDPEPYLINPAVDLVVHHEGERTIARLLELFDANRLDANKLNANKLDLESLRTEPGIAFRQDGKVVINQPRALIENLDELPLPARDLIDMDRYLQTWEDDRGYSSMTISTTRGCPFGCVWCRDAVHGQGFRQRSPESVAAEVATLAKSYDITRLRVVDDVDGIEREWFEQWADAAEESASVIPFEPLNDVVRKDIPLLDVQDSL